MTRRSEPAAGTSGQPPARAEGSAEEDGAPRGRTKRILLPAGDDGIRRFVEAESPVPVEVVADPGTTLSRFDLTLLVVEAVEPPLQAAAARVLADGLPYAVLVRRDVWGAADERVQQLLEDVQRDPRRKLIRFWRDRDDLERTLRDDVFTLDDVAYLGQTIRDGSFVKVGSRFEQEWALENTGFRTWADRALRELASECLEPDAREVPIPPTAPGERVSVSVGFTAPDAPATCLSVWQVVEADGGLAFPWTPGARCQVLAVL